MTEVLEETSEQEEIDKILEMCGTSDVDNAVEALRMAINVRDERRNKLASIIFSHIGNPAMISGRVAGDFVVKEENAEPSFRVSDSKKVLPTLFVIKNAFLHAHYGPVIDVRYSDIDVPSYRIALQDITTFTPISPSLVHAE